MLSLFRLSLLSLLVVATLTTSRAQLPSLGTKKDTTEQKQPEWPPDSLGRRTPRGTIVGFVEAVSDEDYARAARYLNMSTVAESYPDMSGAELAQTLRYWLDQRGNIVPRSLISDEPSGQADDRLGPRFDLIGTAEAGEEEVDILLEKTRGSAGGPIWLFSAETVRRIPEAVDEVNQYTVNHLLPPFLLNNKWNGVPIGQWLALLVSAIVAYLLAWATLVTLVTVTKQFWRELRSERSKLSVPFGFQPGFFSRSGSSLSSTAT